MRGSHTGLGGWGDTLPPGGPGKEVWKSAQRHHRTWDGFPERGQVNPRVSFAHPEGFGAVKKTLGIIF